MICLRTPVLTRLPNSLTLPQYPLAPSLVSSQRLEDMLAASGNDAAAVISTQGPKLDVLLRDSTDLQAQLDEWAAISKAA